MCLLGPLITPRWLYVLAGATPKVFGGCGGRDTATFDPTSVQVGDVVGIGIHIANALRGNAIGKMARERGAHVVFGGIQETLYPEKRSVWEALIVSWRAMAMWSGRPCWRTVATAFRAPNI